MESSLDFRFDEPSNGIRPKLRALVYDSLPPTTAITDYAIGLEKLSADGQFFVDVETAESL